MLRWVDANDCRFPERRNFRVWLHDKIQTERERSGKDGLGNGALLVRSNEYTDCDTGAPYYWNELLGWTSKSDARHYTAFEIEQLGLSQASVTIVRLDETQFKTDDTTADAI